jgi:hypothetical protein
MKKGDKNLGYIRKFDNNCPKSTITQYEKIGQSGHPGDDSGAAAEQTRSSKVPKDDQNSNNFLYLKFRSFFSIFTASNYSVE